MLETLKAALGGGNRGGKGAESPLTAWWSALNLRMQRWIFRSFLGTADRLQVYKQLLILLSNQIPLQSALAEMYVVLSRRDEAIDPNRDFGPQLRELLRETPRQPAAILMQEILRSLETGGSMSAVLGLWVSDQEHSLIRSGEKANKPVPALRKTIFALKMRGRLTKALMGALLMPVLLFLGIFIGLFIVGFGLVPTFLQIMPLERWHGDTRTLIDMGLFASHWAIPIVVGTTVLLGALAWSFPNLTGPLRDRLDQIPPWSIFRMFHGSVFLLNLSTLLSNTPMEDALRIMSEKASPYIKERLTHALRGLAKGKNIGEALHLAEHRFPDDNSIGFLRVLSARAGFIEALDGSIEDWLDQNIDAIVRIANLMRFIAIVVGGWFLVTMFTGVYGLTQAAKG
jgi:type II secretory pathway component PulF